jgi:hypothetical protein
MEMNKSDQQLPLTDSTIYAFGAGNALPRELQEALNECWQEAVANGEKRALIADILGVDGDKLDDKSEAPLRIEAASAGMAAPEIAVLVTWIASEVLLPTAKDLAKEVLKAKLKQLWTRVLQPAIEAKLLPGAIGREQNTNAD